MFPVVRNLGKNSEKAMNRTTVMPNTTPSWVGRKERHRSAAMRKSLMASALSRADEGGETGDAAHSRLASTVWAYSSGDRERHVSSPSGRMLQARRVERVFERRPRSRKGHFLSPFGFSDEPADALRRRAIRSAICRLLALPPFWLSPRWHAELFACRLCARFAEAGQAHSRPLGVRAAISPAGPHKTLHGARSWPMST